MSTKRCNHRIVSIVLLVMASKPPVTRNVAFSFRGLKGASDGCVPQLTDKEILQLLEKSIIKTKWFSSNKLEKLKRNVRVENCETHFCLKLSLTSHVEKRSVRKEVTNGEPKDEISVVGNVEK